MDQNFDIIFVIGYHRAAHSIGFLVAQFSKTYKVAVLLMKNSEEIDKKTGKYKQRFTKDFTQDIQLISIDDKVKTKVLYLQQYDYPTSFLENAAKNIVYDVSFIHMSFASTGTAKFDSPIQIFGDGILLAQDKKFLNKQIKERNISEIYNSREIIEVGLPYEESIDLTVEIDWLILTPTTFSLADYKTKNDFLLNLYYFMSNKNKKETFVYKGHNGNQKDSLININQKLKYINWLFGNRLLGKLIKIEKKIPSKYLKLLIYFILQIKVLSRLKFLKDIHTRDYLAAELFMPLVRRGIIGGFSNTIWGAAYYGKPYYCMLDDRTFNQILNDERASRLLGFNLNYFLPNGCTTECVPLDINPDIRMIGKSKCDIVNLVKTALDEFEC